MTENDTATDQPHDQDTEHDTSGPDTVPEDENESETGNQSSPSGNRKRDVVVPMRMYKAVTVFTTLFAVATVVGGFVVLDTATNRARASLSEVDPLLALLGIGLIVAGATAYAFSTRFRAEGMGKAKDDTDEPSDNG